MLKSKRRSPYRVENGEPCIDVKVKSVEQLFDNRDPAPFRERDLDPTLADYLRDASDDLYGSKSFRVVFWVEEPCLPAEVEMGVRAHFEYVLERSRRMRAGRRRVGQLALLLAVILVVALLSLAKLVADAFPGQLGSGLSEGLVISSWVVMWRPVEVLIYDWIPVWQERRVVSKLLAAPVELRIGTGPDTPQPGVAQPSTPR
jgi:hypothetical protein